LCVQEVGDDEAISFLHDQILVQRRRHIEAHGYRRGILAGVAVSGVVLAAVGGLFNNRERGSAPRPSISRRGGRLAKRDRRSCRSQQRSNSASEQTAPGPRQGRPR
jgi:hypothetical protein